MPDLTNAGTYHYYDKNKKEIISLTKAVNDWLRANGEKEWGTKKGPMAEFQAYWVNDSKEARKKLDIRINSKAEKEAHERG